MVSTKNWGNWTRNSWNANGGAFGKCQIKIGTNDPLQVIVVQRNSKTSGWKVDAYKFRKSVIGGIEPELDEIVNKCVNNGTLKASHNYESLSDADDIGLCSNR